MINFSLAQYVNPFSILYTKSRSGSLILGRFSDQAKHRPQRICKWDCGSNESCSCNGAGFDTSDNWAGYSKS